MSNPHIPSNGQGNLANLMGVMGVAQAISFPTKKQSNFQENSVEKDRVQNTKSKSLSLRRASSQGLQSKYLST